MEEIFDDMPIINRVEIKVELDEITTSVYIEIDKDNNIIEIFSSDFKIPTETSIKIDEGFGDKYRHAQGHYFEKPLMNEDGTYNYAYQNGKVIEK